jgi:hypothetical protein
MKWALRADFFHSPLTAQQGHLRVRPATGARAHLTALRRWAFNVRRCHPDAQTRLRQCQLQETSNSYCLPGRAGGPPLVASPRAIGAQQPRIGLAGATWASHVTPPDYGRRVALPVRSPERSRRSLHRGRLLHPFRPDSSDEFERFFVAQVRAFRVQDGRGDSSTEGSGLRRCRGPETS